MFFKPVAHTFGMFLHPESYQTKSLKNENSPGEIAISPGEFFRNVFSKNSPGEIAISPGEFLFFRDFVS